MTKPISILTAAKELGDQSNWTLHYLQMHRMCYMAHKYYLWKTGKPLIKEHFEAWDYGPICPKLHNVLKKHGSNTISEETLAYIKSIPENHLGIRYLFHRCGVQLDSSLRSTPYGTCPAMPSAGGRAFVQRRTRGRRLPHIRRLVPGLPSIAPDKPDCCIFPGATGPSARRRSLPGCRPRFSGRVPAGRARRRS